MVNWKLKWQNSFTNLNQENAFISFKQLIASLIAPMSLKSPLPGSIEGLQSHPCSLQLMGQYGSNQGGLSNIQDCHINQNSTTEHQQLGSSLDQT